MSPIANPAWMAAVWPVVVFTGGILWFGGRHREAFERIREAQIELSSIISMLEERARVTSHRLDRLDIRLTATETNVGNQARILDRIESKLDRLIESRHFQAELP